MILRAQYGQPFICDIPLITAGATSFQANPTLASGDVKVSRDEGTFANIETEAGTGVFADYVAVSPASSRNVKLTLNATLLTCKRLVIHLIDAAGAEWIDQMVYIETYGSPNAQHPDGVVYFGTLAAYSGGPPTTADLPSGANTNNDFYNGGILRAVAGTGAGQSVSIADYVGSTTRRLTFDRAPAVAFDTTTVVQILDAPLSSTLLELADAIWDEVIEGTETGRQMMRLIRSMAAGKRVKSGNNQTFRDVADTKDRIDHTGDGSGSTVSLTTDAT